MTPTEQPEDLRAEIDRYMKATNGMPWEPKLDHILRLCEAAVLAALPEKVDMDKYEDMTAEGGLNIAVDEDNMAVTGNNLAHLAQFSDDKGWNECRATAQANIHSVFGGTQQ